MLLVIISLMTATILTMSYLSSRDNSAEIGRNAAAAASARWAALSGLDLAIAAIQTETDWRTLHTNGVLMKDHEFHGMTLHVAIADVDTGFPPTAETTSVRITATAISNGASGIQQSCSAIANVLPASEGVIQLDLADFALFADEEIRIRNDAVVAPWPKAPTTLAGAPINFGIRSTLAGSVQFESNTVVIDPRVHFVESADSGLISGLTVRTEPMLDVIPFPMPPSPGVSEPDEANASLQLAAPATISESRRVNDFVAMNGTVRVTLQGDVALIVDDFATIKQGAGIRVDGNAMLIVFGDLTLERNSYIELQPGATLQIFLAGNLLLDDAYIGEYRADKTVRDHLGTAPWIDTNRVQIRSLATADSGSPAWELTENSVVKGSIYAPHASILVRRTSAVYGRIAAQSIEIRNNAAIFYDTALNERCGYTNRDSAIFTADGNVRSVFQNLTALSSNQLNNVAEDYGLRIHVFGDTIGTTAQLVDSSSVTSEDPTPRPIEVDYKLTYVGMDRQAFVATGN